MKRTLLLTTILLLLSWHPVFGQAGIISGTVTEAGTREPLIGANIMIDGTTMGAATNLDGEYQIMNVRPGTYTLIVRYIGYQTQRIEDVLVQSDLRTVINVQLETAAFEGQEITFRAQRDAVTRDRTSSESRVGRQELEALPVQELGDVLNLQAGVTQSSSGAIHIRGGRASEVAYIIDGIRVTDDFDRSLGVRVENNSIEELQVVSGAFNAEYGQAMSGIINISTRSGSNNFRGNVRVWGGDYFSPDGVLYPGIANEFVDIRPYNQYNVELGFSGPIIRDKLTYFISGRRYSSNGWFYGYNAYTPWGPLLPGQDRFGRPVYESVDAGNPVNRYGDRIDFDLPWFTEAFGPDPNRIYYVDSGMRDSSMVAMQAFESISGQGNLQWNVRPGLRFNLIGNYAIERGKSFDGRFTWKLIPDAIPSFERNNYYVNFRTTITPTDRTFITINNAMRYNTFNRQLFSNLNDPRFFNYDRLAELPSIYQPGQNGIFRRVGTDNGVLNRTSQTFINKIEITSQITPIHYVKAGVEFQYDIIDFDSYGLMTVVEGVQPLSNTDNLGIPEIGSRNRETFERTPWLLSAFIQDRIELQNLIINAGLRFEYFQPNGQVPADSENPELFDLPRDRSPEFWADASPKFQLSPRLGIAYPISESGVIHFSYGYFLQLPEYSRLYNGDQIVMQQASGIYGPYGNPDLKPQQTIQYELGLQQELVPGSVIEVSGFYRDIRDWISSGPTNVTALDGVRYGTWVNRDYANVKGITAALTQRIGDRTNMTVDYTFSIAEGSNSDPAAEFNAVRARGDTSDVQLTQMLRPLDWDRRHQLNSTLFYTGNNWGFSVIQRFSTGEPYTSDTRLTTRTGTNAISVVPANNRRKPTNFSLDFNMYRAVSLADYEVRATLSVYNVLDTRNVLNVYGDSGTAEGPLPQFRPQTVEQNFYNNPFFYSEPRRVQVGIEVSF